MILRPTATVRPQPAPAFDVQVVLLLMLAVAFGVIGSLSLILAWVASGDILQLRLEGAWEEPGWQSLPRQLVLALFWPAETGAWLLVGIGLSFPVGVGHLRGHWRL